MKWMLLNGKCSSEMKEYCGNEEILLKERDTAEKGKFAG